MKKAETESPVVEGGLAWLERKIWWGRWGGFAVDEEGALDEPNRVPYLCQFRGVAAELLVQGVYSRRGGLRLWQIKGQKERLNRESLQTHCRPDTVPVHPMGNSGEKLAHCLLHENGFGQKRRRQWHPTPVLLPGKSYGQRNLVGCSPWGWEESDMTERLHFHFSLLCIGEGNGNPLPCSSLERIPGMGLYRVGHDWSDLAVGQRWPSPSTPTLCSPLSWPQSCLDLEGILQLSSKFFLDRVSKWQAPPPNPPR